MAGDKFVVAKHVHGIHKWWYYLGYGVYWLVQKARGVY